MGSTPRGDNYRWGAFKLTIFNQYLGISQNANGALGTYLLWKANRNSYALYRMALFSRKKERKSIYIASFICCVYLKALEFCAHIEYIKC